MLLFLHVSLSQDGLLIISVTSLHIQYFPIVQKIKIDSENLDSLSINSCHSPSTQCVKIRSETTLTLLFLKNQSDEGCLTASGEWRCATGTECLKTLPKSKWNMNSLFNSKNAKKTSCRSIKLKGLSTFKEKCYSFKINRLSNDLSKGISELEEDKDAESRNQTITDWDLNSASLVPKVRSSLANCFLETDNTLL